MERLALIFVFAAALAVAAGGAYLTHLIQNAADEIEAVSDAKSVVDPEPAPEPEPEPASEPAVSTREDLVAYAQQDVELGFLDRNTILERLLETNQEISPPMRKSEVIGVLDRALAQHADDQATWGDQPTDNDKLDAAFAKLESKGLLARQNYEDCGTCAIAAIDEELKEKPKARGYTFYHSQDAEGALQDGSFYLSYGFRDDNKRKSAAIAKEIVAALKKEGLHATWNGDTGTRIAISDFVWRKRR